jgi:hypothetical protein
MGLIFQDLFGFLRGFYTARPLGFTERLGSLHPTPGNAVPLLSPHRIHIAGISLKEHGLNAQKNKPLGLNLVSYSD